MMRRIIATTMIPKAAKKPPTASPNSAPPSIIQILSPLPEVTVYVPGITEDEPETELPVCTTVVFLF